MKATMPMGVQVITGISGSWCVLAKNNSHMPGSNGTYIDAQRRPPDLYGVPGPTYVEVVRSGQVRSRRYFEHRTAPAQLIALACEVFG